MLFHQPYAKMLVSDWPSPLKSVAKDNAAANAKHLVEKSDPRRSPSPAQHRWAFGSRDRCRAHADLEVHAGSVCQPDGFAPTPRR